MMEKKQTIHEKVTKAAAKYFEIDESEIFIDDTEPRENWNGKRLKAGQSVYVTLNSGVDGEPVQEFIGWIIGNKFYNKTSCKIFS